jgi:hypothetical protein
MAEAAKQKIAEVEAEVCQRSLRPRVLRRHHPLHMLVSTLLPPLPFNPLSLLQAAHSY